MEGDESSPIGRSRKKNLRNGLREDTSGFWSKLKTDKPTMSRRVAFIYVTMLMFTANSSNNNNGQRSYRRTFHEESFTFSHPLFPPRHPPLVIYAINVAALRERRNIVILLSMQNVKYILLPLLVMWKLHSELYWRIDLIAIEFLKYSIKRKSTAILE